MQVSDGHGACACPYPPVSPGNPVPLCETHLRQAAGAQHRLRPRPWFRSEMAQDAISGMVGRAMEGRGVRGDAPALLACVYGCCEACNPLIRGPLITCHGCGIPLLPFHGWFGDDVYIMQFEPDGEPHAPGCRGRWTGGPHYGETA